MPRSSRPARRRRYAAAWPFALLPLLASAPAFATGSVVSHCPTTALGVEPGQSIQEFVDRAPPGAAFCLKSGIHRMQVVRPKDGQQFYGEDRVILNGSRVLTDFSREGRYWVSAEHRLRNSRAGSCRKDAPTCGFSEIVFIDGRRLERVLRREELAPGFFYYDFDAGKIYLADDLEGKTVEITVAVFAFGGTANDVVIDNVTVEKYASLAQRGAIDAQGGARWQISHCRVRWNSSAGISVGTGTTVRQCDILLNGQIGITGAGHNIRIQGNYVSANNARGFSHGWEAGGVKISLADNTIFRGNRVFDNHGPGLWCDGDCRNTVYEDNILERNDNAGIFHEISYDAVIRNNVLRDNARAKSGWFWASEILVAGSEGVEIYDNKVFVGPGRCAIMLIDQGRRDNGRLRKTRNNSVHDNDIWFDDQPCAGGTSDVPRSDENYTVIVEGNNRFDRNTYHVPKRIRRFRFVWGRNEDLDWSGFRRFGQEPNGQMVLY